MIILKDSKTGKILSFSLVILLLAGIISSSRLHADVCEDARDACIISALMVAIISWNIAVFSGLAVMCSIGYEWCKKYYEK